VTSHITQHCAEWKTKLHSFNIPVGMMIIQAEVCIHATKKLNIGMSLRAVLDSLVFLMFFFFGLSRFFSFDSFDLRLRSLALHTNAEHPFGSLSLSLPLSLSLFNAP